MASDTEVQGAALALVQAQSRARADLTSLTQAAVTAQVRAFSGWYDSAAITEWAGRLAKLTRANQKATAASTEAFATRIIRLLTGVRPQQRGPVAVADLWGGVPLESVYGRLADNYRFLEATRSDQAPVEARISPMSREELPVLDGPSILDRILTRADVQAETAITLAFRQQWAASLEQSAGIAGYRRVIHPELSAGGSCGLCVAASDQVYGKSDLLPIHARCACSVTPVVGDVGGIGDPGSAINQVDLAKLYRAAGDSTAGRHLKAARFEVHQHGELGPVLVVAKQRFRGPADVPQTAQR